MKIAVLSGKGGTGKTFVSVNLAKAAGKATYADCDAEEPNGHLFLKPDNVIERPVYVKVPVIDANKCNGCRKCVNFCRYGALTFILNRPMLFPEMCHACGGCTLICDTGAIKEIKRPIGKVCEGTAKDLRYIGGQMNTGETSATPIVREVYDSLREGTSIIDCPPGSACMAMESIRDADYCVLVTEPTAFGSHNLSTVHKLSVLFDKPCGAILNKCIGGSDPSKDYCKKNNLRILGEIPLRKDIARSVSEGTVVFDTMPDMKKMFTDFFNKIEEILK